MNKLSTDLLIKITSFNGISNYYLTNKILCEVHKFHSNKFKLKKKYFKAIKNYWYAYPKNPVNVQICRLRDNCKNDLIHIQNTLNDNFLNIDYKQLKILTNQYCISRESYKRAIERKKREHIRSRLVRRLNNIGMTDSDEVDIDNLTGWGYNY